MESPLFYSTAQAAQLLNCSSEHVRQLIDRGELEGRRIGRKILVPVSAIAKVQGDIPAPHEQVKARDRDEKVQELRQLLAKAQVLLADLS
jgi:excisionase family DNA binding protein